MRALLQRLSLLDASVENAVRVIALFDGLVQQRIALDAMVRSAAHFSECPVGVNDPITNLTLRSAADGRPLHEAKPAWARSHPVDRGGEVWLERNGTPHPLDDLVLERFAAAVAIVRDRQLAALPRLGDPALVELVISSTSGDPERSRALHLIGLTPSTRVQVLALAGVRAHSDVPAMCPDLLGHAPVQDLHAVLVLDSGLPDTPQPPGGVRVGVGPLVRADQAWRSWRCARLAVRFTAGACPGYGTRMVRWDDLGGYAALAEFVPADVISEIPDVAALDSIAAQRTGGVTIAALRSVCQTESLRHAAAAMHMHHSSVTARVERAEAALGFSVRTATGRNRLALALTLRHLRDTH